MRHSCEKLKGQVCWREDLQYWLYISEEGRWATQVDKCPICKEQLQSLNDTSVAERLRHYPHKVG